MRVERTVGQGEWGKWSGGSYYHNSMWLCHHHCCCGYGMVNGEHVNRWEGAWTGVVNSQVGANRLEGVVSAISGLNGAVLSLFSWFFGWMGTGLDVNGLDIGWMVRANWAWLCECICGGVHCAVVVWGVGKVALVSSNSNSEECPWKELCFHAPMHDLSWVVCFSRLSSLSCG